MMIEQSSPTMRISCPSGPGGGFRTMHLHNDSPNAHGTVVML